jgi:uncharacterized protein YkwD
MTRARSAVRSVVPLQMATLVVGAATWSAPAAHADDSNTLVPNNARLNSAIFADIYAAQHQYGCTTDPKRDGRLVDAARRHALDVVNHPDINGDIGSDGSQPQDRARDAGFNGKVAETVATMANIAINGIDVLGQWWWDPPSRAIMQDCANTAIGVWTENSPGRSALVAVYGQPVAQ